MCVNLWRASSSFWIHALTFSMHVHSLKRKSPIEGLLHMTERNDEKQRNGLDRGSLSKRNWEH